MYQGQSIQVTKLDGGIAELCFDNKTDSVNKFDLLYRDRAGRSRQAAGC